MFYYSEINDAFDDINKKFGERFDENKYANEVASVLNNIEDKPKFINGKYETINNIPIKENKQYVHLIKTRNNENLDNVFYNEKCNNIYDKVVNKPLTHRECVNCILKPNLESNKKKLNLVINHIEKCSTCQFEINKIKKLEKDFDINNINSDNNSLDNISLDSNLNNIISNFNKNNQQSQQQERQQHTQQQQYAQQQQERQQHTQQQQERQQHTQQQQYAQQQQESQYERQQESQQQNGQQQERQYERQQESQPQNGQNGQQGQQIENRSESEMINRIISILSDRNERREEKNKGIVIEMNMMTIGVSFIIVLLVVDIMLKLRR